MENFLDIITSPTLQQILLPVRIFFMGISLFFVAFIVFFLLRTRWFGLRFGYDIVEFFTLRLYGSYAAGRKWRSVKRRAKRADENDFNKLVVECHDILDKLLMRLVPVFQANSYGERLAKIGEGTFPNIKDIWDAHEAYRSIKKDPNFRLSGEQFVKILEAYDQAFQELGIK